MQRSRGRRSVVLRNATVMRYQEVGVCRRQLAPQRHVESVELFSSNGRTALNDFHKFRFHARVTAPRTSQSQCS